MVVRDRSGEAGIADEVRRRVRADDEVVDRVGESRAPLLLGGAQREELEKQRRRWPASRRRCATYGVLRRSGAHSGRPATPLGSSSAASAFPPGRARRGGGLLARGERLQAACRRAVAGAACPPSPACVVKVPAEGDVREPGAPGDVRRSELVRVASPGGWRCWMLALRRVVHGVRGTRAHGLAVPRGQPSGPLAATAYDLLLQRQERAQDERVGHPLCTAWNRRSRRCLQGQRFPRCRGWSRTTVGQCQRDWRGRLSGAHTFVPSRRSASRRGCWPTRADRSISTTSSGRSSWGVSCPRRPAPGRPVVKVDDLTCGVVGHV